MLSHADSGDRHLTRRDSIRTVGAVALAAALHLPDSRARGTLDPVEVAPGLSVFPRHAWGADLPPVGPLATEDVKFLLVHHTATATNHADSEVAGVIRSSFRYHTGPEKGWPDVTYNFFVDRFGRVWEGRSGSLAGPVMVDATGGSQGFAQLVCVIGDFTSVMPSEAALQALVRTLAWLAERFGVDTSLGSTTEFTSRGSSLWPAGTLVEAATIAGHRDMSRTACPGDTFYPFVAAELPAAVHSMRAATQQSTTSTSVPMTAGPAESVPPSVLDTATTVGTSKPVASTAVPPTSGPPSSPARTASPPTSMHDRRPTQTVASPVAPTAAEAPQGSIPTNWQWPVGIASAGAVAGLAVAVARRGVRPDRKEEAP